jgi:hypothetical protein
VSYYALFQGWLLLSQPPGCLRTPTTFPTQRVFRDLSRRSGLFPSWRRRLAPAASLVDPSRGIRSLVECGNPHWAPSPSSGSTSTSRADPRLYLHTFRGEPAISRFDWNFSSAHSSSPSFATLVGSGLDGVLPPLHPGHGKLTWFRASYHQLARPLQTRFRSGSTALSPLNLALVL